MKQSPRSLTLGQSAAIMCYSGDHVGVKVSLGRNNQNVIVLLRNYFCMIDMFVLLGTRSIIGNTTSP